MKRVKGAKGMTTGSLAERLSAYAAGLRFEDLTPEAVHEVKRRLLDSLGCAMGAYRERAGGDRPAAGADHDAARFPPPSSARATTPRRSWPPLPTASTSATSTTTTPTSPKSPRTPATTWRPCWRSPSRRERAGATSSRRRCWPTRSSAACAMRRASGRAAGTTSPTAPSRPAWRPASCWV